MRAPSYENRIALKTMRPEWLTVWSGEVRFEVPRRVDSMSLARDRRAVAHRLVLLWHHEREFGLVGQARLLRRDSSVEEARPQIQRLVWN
jgi:hypothetical protein